MLYYIMPKLGLNWLNSASSPYSIAVGPTERKEGELQAAGCRL